MGLNGRIWMALLDLSLVLSQRNYDLGTVLYNLSSLNCFNINLPSGTTHGYSLGLTERFGFQYRLHSAFVAAFVRFKTQSKFGWLAGDPLAALHPPIMTQSKHSSPLSPKSSGSSIGSHERKRTAGRCLLLFNSEKAAMAGDTLD